MSWSFGMVGTREEVIAKARALEAPPSSPPEELADVAAAKIRIEALVGALDLSAPGAQVRASAGGSHSWGNGGTTSASFSVSVSVAT